MICWLVDSICDIAGVEDGDGKETNETNEEQMEQEGEDEWIDGEKREKSGPRLKKKEVVSTVVVSQMLYARSQRANAFQTMMGYYLNATNTTKNVISCMNYMGTCISYSTITKAANACAEASDKELKNCVATGDAVGGFMDNMVTTYTVGEETLTNKQETLNWTARGAFKI